MNENPFIIKAKISIVIDDLGDNSIIARKLLSLPAKVTAAILPATPHAKLISDFAFKQGHEVILHLPMEAFTRTDLLDSSALLSNMDELTFTTLFDKNTTAVPHIIGFNNHMGSLLTENKEKMGWLMNQAKNKKLFFLDSKTSEHSIAESVAQEEGIPTIARDIFLDHNKQYAAILKQFNLSKKIARKQGKVVVICHPYPETLNFLQQNIASLNTEFELVGLSDLLPKEKQQAIQPSFAR